jgi:hypothetical protein
MQGFNLVAPLGKKEVSAQSRQAAKSFFFAPLRLCATKKQITHTKALRASLISLRLSAAADRAFLLSEKKKKLARKDAKTQRVFFFAPLRLCAPKKK